MDTHHVCELLLWLGASSWHSTLHWTAWCLMAQINQMMGNFPCKATYIPSSSNIIPLFTSHFNSVAQSCPTLCNPMNHSMPGLPIHHQLPEFTQTHVHQVGDAIQPSHPPSSPSPSAPNPSQHQGLSQWFSSSHQVVKVWSFSFNISPSNEHPGLVSFSMDWLDLLAVQGTLKSLLQHHSSKASILQHSAFFTVQLTSIYDHWKNHSLD